MERFTRILFCILYNVIALALLFAAVMGTYRLAAWLW